VISKDSYQFFCFRWVSRVINQNGMVVGFRLEMNSKVFVFQKWGCTSRKGLWLPNRLRVVRSLRSHYCEVARPKWANNISLKSTKMSQPHELPQKHIHLHLYIHNSLLIFCVSINVGYTTFNHNPTNEQLSILRIPPHFVWFFLLVIYRGFFLLHL